MAKGKKKQNEPVMGRVISKGVMSKRGCVYCTDFNYGREEPQGALYRKKIGICPHDECPYHELDGYASYADYLKANEMNFYNLHNGRRRSGESG